MNHQLKKVLDDRKISVTEATDLFNMSRNAIYKHLKGNLTLSTLRFFAEKLNCSIFELIDEDQYFTHVYKKGKFVGIKKR